MPIEDALQALRFDRQFMDHVTAWERFPARPASYADFPDGLDPRLTAALRTLGVAPLYTHQAAAIQAAMAGENVVVVTGTASGKTLCYNLPVLHALLNDPQARALYLFPTKALAQDQAASLGAYLQELDATALVPVRTYDGDMLGIQDGWLGLLQNRMRELDTQMKNFALDVSNRLERLL